VSTEAAPKSFASPIALDALVAFALLLAGAIVFLWYGIVFERKQDGPTLAALGRMGAWIGTRVYTPTLFVVFGFGVALVEKANLPWDQFWIVFGIVGWSLATVIGVGFVGPELGRIDRAAQEFGPESPEVTKRVKRLFAIFRFDSALLVLIVLDMAAKPSF
jgi:uncharacterized membrane protein